MLMTSDKKTAKVTKRWYYAPSHRLNVKLAIATLGE